MAKQNKTRTKRSSAKSKRKRSQKKGQTSLWQSRGMVVGLAVIVVIIGISVVKEAVRRVETQYEIQRLEGEVARLQDRNSQLGDLIALFNTSTLQEQNARQRLGVQEPGEQVLHFPDRDEQKEIVLPDSDTIEYIPITTYQSNPEKWYSYFMDRWNNIAT